ncbi:TPA: hypothetical protein MNF94_004368 [Citrobacter freundii]|nr:hypothetical protein [Citrobacter freundii]HBZ8897364.1 hypothetical protein [Citrobacter freundii]HBZ8952442.1 hypothetical protein [Citrobacter freundii]HBZ9227106.1 hypothetical protein [Citrobacter freundii]HBZ9400017.1 hypothetical protein [Citrobacter freundii]
MAKKTALLGLFALFVSSVAFAETTSNWVEVTTADDGIFSAKKGTFRSVKGDSSALFMYQTKNKKVEYYKVSIKDADCDSGYGEVRFFYMDGKLAFKGDYVADGNSVGAGIGDFMCGVRIGLNTQKS